MSSQLRQEISDLQAIKQSLEQRIVALESSLALRDSTRMVTTLMDNLPGMVYACANDPDWTMMFVSAGVCELTGYSSEEFVEQRSVTFGTLIHPDDRDRIWDAIQATLSVQHSFEFEYRIRTADGCEKWVWERGRGVFADDGTLLHLEGFITDITSRKQADERLRQTENFYRALIERAPDGVVLVRDNHFAYISPTAKRMFGYDISEAFVETPDMLTHPDDLPVVLAEITQTIVDPSYVPTLQYRFRHKHGAWIWIESTFSNLMKVAGVEGLVINFRDITAQRAQEFERRRAEEALREREALLRAVVDNVPFEFWARDCGERCFMENAALVRHWGSLLGQYPEEAHISPAELALWKSNNRRALAGEVVSEEVEYWLGDQQRMFHNIIAPIRVGDTIQGFLGLNIDITERKRVEEELAVERALLAERVEMRTAELRIANAELARASRLKDEFLANMSHELRTPLNDILGRSELLQDGIYGSVSASQMNALRSIETSGRHLLSLITDILDLSKIEAGKLSLQYDTLKVDLLCRMSIHMVSHSAMVKQLVLHTSIDPQVNTLCADELRLKQILVNLLSNAIKFTPAGGQVGMDVRGDGEHRMVTFTVWDTGIGIAEEDRAHLFQPFTQIDSGLNRQYNGTGLGLSLVDRLTRAHHGQVTLESTVGKGSRFHVTLPWVEGAVPAVPAPEAAEPPRASVVPTPQLHSILLVDDSPMSSRVVEEYLKSHGYQVVVVQSGSDALTSIAARPPSLVIMDIQMPEMDGLTVIRCIRDELHVPMIPIIALTALAMMGDRERCLEAGAQAYFAKPVQLRELLKTVNALIANTN